MSELQCTEHGTKPCTVCWAILFNDNGNFIRQLADKEKEIEACWNEVKYLNGRIYLKDDQLLKDEVELSRTQELVKTLVKAIKTQIEASGNCTCGGCVKGKNALFLASKEGFK